MQSPQPAIELAGLTKQFGRQRAVGRLTLAVHSGSMFGFLGPNGAGKTTTIRMLLGLIRPTRGGGRILGYDIERERAAILPRVGAIVESPAFYPLLSGRDNLRVFARTAGNEDTKTIEKVLEQVGLSERAQDKVKTYSLGMKQRLAIAAALFIQARLTGIAMASNGSISPVHLPGAQQGLLGLIPIAVVVLYLVVPLTVAAIVFRKRDMVGIG